MTSQAGTPEEYISELSPERAQTISKLRSAIKKNLPKGFQEGMGYGMIAYFAPHSLFPDGYHCDPKLPLPFANLASQKNHIAFYHMGLYTNEKLKSWFLSEYSKSTKFKLDMGKSCLRFKNADQIPYALIGELMAKMTPEEWIQIYTENFRKK